MLKDDLHQVLKELEPDVVTIKTFWNNSGNDKQIQELEEESNKPDFWQKTEQAKELQRLKLQQETYQAIVENYQEQQDLLDLFANDEATLQKMQDDIFQLKRTVLKFKITLLLNKPDDSANCFFVINSGAGGTESQDWANMLLRMYTRFCEKEGFSIQVLDYQPGEEAGIKSATLFIKGKNAYGLLKTEHGVHRLVRVSPFDANQRRHTSFAAVSVTPEQPETAEVSIEPKDIRIDTYRASGAGGQHVNKTDSAVRITHLTTGIVVQCQNERSQIQNRETAMKMLKAKLAQKQKEEQDAKLASIEKKKAEWGSQIRSYVLHPYKMVKDHRTSHESAQPDLVLDGELMPFIEQALVQEVI